MTTRAYYLDQARILLDMAARMSAKQDADRLITRANEYQLLADAMPEDDQPAARNRPPPATVVQSMQQQQSKDGNKDEDKG
jgi:hypothetical protein